MDRLDDDRLETGVSREREPGSIWMIERRPNKRRECKDASLLTRIILFFVRTQSRPHRLLPYLQSISPDNTQPNPCQQTFVPGIGWPIVSLLLLTLLEIPNAVTLQVLTSDCSSLLGQQTQREREQSVEMASSDALMVISFRMDG